MVAGIRTPEDLDSMKKSMPNAYKELVENCETLESHYKDMMVRSESVYNSINQNCVLNFKALFYCRI